MKQMKIDDFYLNEAKRIRIAYLNNIQKIKSLEPYLNSYKITLEGYMDTFKSIVNSSKPDEEKSKLFFDEIESLNIKVDTTQAMLKPLYAISEQLEKDGNTLKNSIESKYVGISIDDIQKQIYAYIPDLF